MKAVRHLLALVALALAATTSSAQFVKGNEAVKVMPDGTKKVETVAADRILTTRADRILTRGGSPSRARRAVDKSTVFVVAGLCSRTMFLRAGSAAQGVARSG